MPKQIIGETFEQLGRTAGQTAKQMVQEPAKMAEVAGKQMAGSVSASEEKGAGGQTAGPVQKAMNKRAVQSRLDYLQKELAVLRENKAQEEQLRQVQVQPKQEAIKQLEKEQKKKEEPLVVSLAKQKAGTGERKRMGVSG